MKIRLKVHLTSSRKTHPSERLSGEENTLCTVICLLSGNDGWRFYYAEKIQHLLLEDTKV